MKPPIAIAAEGLRATLTRAEEMLRARFKVSASVPILDGWVLKFSPVSARKGRRSLTYESQVGGEYDVNSMSIEQMREASAVFSDLVQLLMAAQDVRVQEVNLANDNLTRFLDWFEKEEV